MHVSHGVLRRPAWGWILVDGAWQVKARRRYSGPMAGATIVARDLRKSYGNVEAVRGIDLEVQTGEIFALLGPNGAGKTTTVEIFEGYRERSGGDVEVLGIDPRTRPASGARASVSYCRPAGCRPTDGAGVARAVRRLLPQAAPPLAETSRSWGLTDQRDKRAGTSRAASSGGSTWRSRWSATPTSYSSTSRPPASTRGARREAWEAIAALRDAGGKTVLLTTHYMDEAQRLADRVAIVAGGQIVAEGRPGEIGRAEPVTTITFRLPAGIAVAELPTRGDGQRRDGHGANRRAAARPARAAGLGGRPPADLSELEAKRESLEDVYLELTRARERPQAGLAPVSLRPADVPPRPRVRGFIVAFPVIFLVIFVTIFGNDDDRVEGTRSRARRTTCRGSSRSACLTRPT